MARLWAAMACLAACGDGGLSRFDGEDVPPPPPIGQAERVRIVGSSTVAPFSTTVAEHFGAATRFATPIVETTGSGGGFKAFCRDIGPDEPAIANASRRIKPSEIELCAAAGVTQIVPVPIGYDGIVLANAKTGPRFDITKAQLYLALADALPDGDGRWRSNPHKSWSDVDPALPDEPILVSGPPPTSGTRDAFVEIAMEAGALALPEL
ncbi:MAG: substrate-binding domain-containing protein, partial [Pseudomonadota bacterium]